MRLVACGQQFPKEGTMGLFGERHDLLRQLADAQARLESLQTQRNALDWRVRKLEHEAELSANRERALRDALELLVKNCNAELSNPLASAVQMARAALRETESKE
jgi:cell division protein FtsB